MANMCTENDLVNHYNLKPADRIVVPKSGLKIVQHHALYLGYDEYGRHWIAENKFGIGVTVTRVNDFFRENPHLTRKEAFSGSGAERKAAVQKALRLHGQPYNLINYNCEHFVNHVVHDKISSGQVAVGALAGVALVVGIFALLGRGK